MLDQAGYGFGFKPDSSSSWIQAGFKLDLDSSWIQTGF
jgi:hypothetical protein